MKSKFYFLQFIFIFLLSLPVLVSAQTSLSLPDGHLLQDFNGDGQILIAAFGDSITKGEGDFISPDSDIEMTPAQTRPAGYPFRIETMLGVNVRNLGNPGEALTSEGTVGRFAAQIFAIRPDVVIIDEGINDGRNFAPPSSIYRKLQSMINIAKAAGAVPVISTLYHTTGNHNFLNAYVDQYNPEIRLLSAVNDISLSDPEHAFNNSCTYPNCKLINQPEGLHPNIDGHDVMGEIMIATLLKINIFAQDGASVYSQALGIPATDVKIAPDAVTQ